MALVAGAAVGAVLTLDESHKRRAATTAALLGDGDLADIQASSWRIAESKRTDFASEVEASVVNDPVTGLSFDKKGVILMQGEEVYVEKILTADLETWKLGLVPASSDKRLLAMDRWTNPGRTKPLTACLEVAASDALDKSPLDGERSALEHALCVQEGAGSCDVYHSERVRDLLDDVPVSIPKGIARATLARVERAEILPPSHYFSIGAPAPAGLGLPLAKKAKTEIDPYEGMPHVKAYVEARREIDVINRNPQTPEVKNLTNVPNLAAGEQEWLSGRLREQGNMWMQDRLYWQEQPRFRGKGGGAGEDSSDDLQDPESRKKKETKPKGPPKGGRKGGASADEGGKAPAAH
jgi:hypothetical protein